MQETTANPEEKVNDQGSVHTPDSDKASRPSEPDLKAEEASPESPTVSQEAAETEAGAGAGGSPPARPDAADDDGEKRTFQEGGFGALEASETEPHEPGNINMLMDLELPIAVELGRVRMLVKEILDLAPGAVVELDKFSGEPVDVYVNQKKFAEGEVVVVDQNFGVRITALIGPTDRLTNLH